MEKEMNQLANPLSLWLGLYDENINTEDKSK